MADFNGFTEQTNTILMGLKFNNNKEWFHKNKADYNEYVTEPMAALGQYCYEYMNRLDSEFQEVPKLSRANRDIRFSKNKAPYKECKYFFLRADGAPNIIYSKPTYFFEISPDWYRYGFFYNPEPSNMAIFRNKAKTNLKAFENAIDYYNNQTYFKLYGEMYKRNFDKNLNDKLSSWYNRKFFEFTHYGDFSDKEFYCAELADVVCNGFELLYPLYQYFKQ